MKGERFSNDVSNGSECWAQCERCQNETKHTCQRSRSVEKTDPEGDIHIRLSFEIVECNGCGWISFRQVFKSSEDLEEREDGSTHPVEHVDLFPRRLGTKPIEHDYYLPEAVRGIYLEVLSALRNDQPVLAGIGIRALVEAVCAEKNASGPNLAKRIDSLTVLGVLTPDGAKILHRIRTLGNKAAHEVSAPTSEELRSGLQVAENLLLNAYILSRVAESLPEK